MFALLFIEHAATKLVHFPHVAMFDELKIMSIFGIIDLFGGLLALFGLFTPIAAFILSGELAFVYFMFRAS